MSDKYGLYVAFVLLLSAFGAGVWTERMVFTGTMGQAVELSAMDFEGPTLGDPDAPIKVVEFADFQCPFCAQLAPHTRQILGEFGDSISLVYKHLPLPIHPHSGAAALAAECADSVGAFESMHDLLYEHFRNSRQAPDWMTLAVEADIDDPSDFELCVQSERYRDRVLADVELASRLGFRGTPVLIIDGEAYFGYMTVDQLRNRVRQALE